MIKRSFEVAKFDLSSMPFSQGYAVKAVLESIGGKLLSAGQVVSGYGSTGTLLFVESIRGGRSAQSLWVDDGYQNCHCEFHDLGDGWMGKIDSQWEPIDLELEFVPFGHPEIFAGNS